jgi:hypothetical protein
MQSQGARSPGVRDVRASGEYRAEWIGLRGARRGGERWQNELDHTNGSLVSYERVPGEPGPAWGQAMAPTRTEKE